MGRRKIEIKAIKDDRNRSVTFLKRKGGLFKKAHELSVLCSVDVAVFIFCSNKKLYEYSSSDMRDLITRYTYHGGPNEHKGPADFNGGADEDEDDEENGTPPQGDGRDLHMLHPHYQSQAHFPQHMRHHTPSASPPIQNRAFGQHAQHPGHAMPRGHSPQPPMGSRPASRNDMARMGPNMVPHPVGPQGPQQAAPANGYAYIPQPGMYEPQHGQNMAPAQPQFQYPPQQAQAHPMQPYMEDQRRSSMPPNFPPPQHAPNTSAPGPGRHSASPPQAANQPLPGQPTHMSPPQPSVHLHPMRSPPPAQRQTPPQAFKPVNQHHIHAAQQIKQEHPPASHMEKLEAFDRPRPPPLLDTAIGRQRKQGSIFTPVDENRSVLSQHLAAFHSDARSEPTAHASRAQLVENAVSKACVAKNGVGMPSQRTSSVSEPQRNGSMTSTAESCALSPPSRSNSLRMGGGPRPRLKVQIPDDASDAGDAGSATAESSSPRGTSTTDTTSQRSRRLTEPHSSGVVLPPPSPSASALLSAGATGPPNPFARPPPPQSNSNMNIDTPASALPSRFLNNEFLPSPSSFYPEWNFRGNDSNTLPSPLNFATPLVGTGPSFLREEPTPLKRKSPEMGGGTGHDELANEPKRIRVDS